MTTAGKVSIAIAAFAKQIRLTSAAPSLTARPFWHPSSLPCWYPPSLPRTRPNPSFYEYLLKGHLLGFDAEGYCDGDGAAPAPAGGAIFSGEGGASAAAAHTTVADGGGEGSTADVAPWCVRDVCPHACRRCVVGQRRFPDGPNALGPDAGPSAAAAAGGSVGGGAPVSSAAAANLWAAVPVNNVTGACEHYCSAGGQCRVPAPPLRTSFAPAASVDAWKDAATAGAGAARRVDCRGCARWEGRCVPGKFAAPTKPDNGHDTGDEEEDAYGEEKEYDDEENEDDDGDGVNAGGEDEAREGAGGGHNGDRVCHPPGELLAMFRPAYAAAVRRLKQGPWYVQANMFTGVPVTRIFCTLFYFMSCPGWIFIAMAAYLSFIVLWQDEPSALRQPSGLLARPAGTVG